MGVFDNLSKLKKSQDKKTAVNKIGMEAVKQGAIESSFTSEYSAFSVSLRAILEKALIENDDLALTIAPSSKENAKYLNYVLQDTYFLAYYDITRDKAGNLQFKALNDFEDIIEGIPSTEPEKLTKYEQQLKRFIDI